MLLMVLWFASKKNNQKVAEEQALWRGHKHF